MKRHFAARNICAALLLALPVILVGGLGSATAAYAADDNYAAGWPTIPAGEGGPHINVTTRHDGEWTWHDRSNPEPIAVKTEYQMRIRVENFTYAPLWSPTMTTDGDPSGGQDLRCDFSPFGGPTGVASWPGGSIPHGGVVYCLATAPGRADAGTIYSDYKMTGEIRPTDGTAPYTKWGADWWWGKVEAKPAIDIEKWSTVDGPSGGDFDEAPGKLVPAGSTTPITLTVTNTGNETLMDPTVTDTTLEGAAMTDLSCDFSALGGPATGTLSGITMKPGDSFTCTGLIPALAAGERHSDMAHISIWSNSKLGEITDEDPWYGVGNDEKPVAPVGPGGGVPGEPVPAKPAPGLPSSEMPSERATLSVPAATATASRSVPQLATTGFDSSDELRLVTLSLGAGTALVASAALVRRRVRRG
ncbi:hypothetical protein G7068_08040 [Leucobacter viscericola]|uniref:Gram-positive cocci surface proteins LPxTG domain-containing protein n=1 Tax=Leucobacter viscericola TaxID=2714935 RepID=A0A6G7XF65_9MICO|nr:hypothetical protein [Leucobacter viscericola]QIK63152.1 hypothetical protein G7068_08040 [Leucobacter viscericola]